MLFNLQKDQRLLFLFLLFLCDEDDVEYGCRHLYQRIEEHKVTAIGKHIKENRHVDVDHNENCFSVLWKC